MTEVGSSKADLSLLPSSNFKPIDIKLGKSPTNIEVVP